MYIKTVENIIKNKTGTGKAIVVIEAKQGGKNTLKKIFKAQRFNI